MPLFDFTINVIVFLGIMVLSVLAGYGLRSRQLQRKNRQIAELEKEMLDKDAEVLEVQKEYCELESRMKQMAIPVISIKQASKEEEMEGKDKKVRR